VPSFNEAESILNTLDRLKATLATQSCPHEIIMVDDGSVDDSVKQAQQCGGVQILRHPTNIGYGFALKSGIKAAKYEWIGIVDGDGSYAIEDIPILIEEMGNGFDMVVGCRSNLRDMDTRLKRLFRKIFVALVNFTVRGKIEDPNSGMRVFKRDMALSFFPFLSDVFSFTTSLTLMAAGTACFVKYVPSQYYPREGKTKVRHIRDSIRTIQLIIQGMSFFNPLKSYLLLSLGAATFVVCPALALVPFGHRTISLYYLLFGLLTTLMVGLGILADIIRVSFTHKHLARFKWLDVKPS